MNENERLRREEARALWIELHSEIRMDGQLQSGYFALGLGGTALISVQAVTGGNPLVALIGYAPIAIALVLTYARQRDIGRLAAYLRAGVEPLLEGIRWETDLRSTREGSDHSKAHAFAYEIGAFGASLLACALAIASERSALEKATISIVSALLFGLLIMTTRTLEKRTMPSAQDYDTWEDRFRLVRGSNPQSGTSFHGRSTPTAKRTSRLVN